MIAATAYNAETRKSVEISDAESFASFLLFDRSADSVEEICAAIRGGSSVEFSSASGYWWIGCVDNEKREVTLGNRLMPGCTCGAA